MQNRPSLLIPLPHRPPLALLTQPHRTRHRSSARRLVPSRLVSSSFRLARGGSWSQQHSVVRHAQPRKARRCDAMRCDAPRPLLSSDWRRLDWLSPVDSFSSRRIPSVCTADPSPPLTHFSSISLHLSIALHTFMPLRWDRLVTLPPVRPSLHPSFACARQRAALVFTSLASSLSPRQFVLCPSL